MTNAVLRFFSGASRQVASKRQRRKGVAMNPPSQSQAEHLTMHLGRAVPRQQGFVISADDACGG